MKIRRASFMGIVPASVCVERGAPRPRGHRRERSIPVMVCMGKSKMGSSVPSAGSLGLESAEFQLICPGFSGALQT